jgi:hypothetical protein
MVPTPQPTLERSTILHLEKTRGNSSDEPLRSESGKAKAGRKKKSRRQSHGLAWHWKQTDCWYYTLSGTKKRIALFDEKGSRIRGLENKEQARLALARVKLTAEGEMAAAPLASGDWIVAKVCSEYIQYCERGKANGTLSAGHYANVVWILNDFCRFCGALPVPQLKKKHVQTWIESHPRWKSPVTHRGAISVLLASFNYIQEHFEIPNPLKGLKKPPSRPRLWSFTAEEEKALYQGADAPFQDFLFAAIHTGLRPFCELARITADDVEETPRGMMWRVYSSKTKKTRKIPVRPEVAELTRRLMQTAPKGSGQSLFRTKTGKRWQKTHGVLTFLALKRKLGWDQDPLRNRYGSYICRHTFAHRMLAGYWNKGAGCSIETLAELIGDTPKVAFDHYGREWGQHFQDPLWAAMGMAIQPERPSAEATKSDSKKRRRPQATATRQKRRTGKA